MGVEVTISGGGPAEARRIAALCRTQHKRMQSQITRGAKKATLPLERRIREEVKRMPKGYEDDLAADLQVKTSVRRAGVRIIVRAPGRAQERDVAARDRGSLRHPVFSRWKRLKSGAVRDNPWVDQRIRPGFITEPARELGPDVSRQIDRVLDEARQFLEKG